MTPLVVILRAASYFFDSCSTSTRGHDFGRSSLRKVRVFQMYDVHHFKSDQMLTSLESHSYWFLSACQHSQDGTEHAATVATAFYGGADPGRHGNSKSGGILG